jgi:hypothetical protein
MVTGFMGRNRRVGPTMEPRNNNQAKKREATGSVGAKYL